MSNTNPLIRSHQFNYSSFTGISIIGDIIGDNRSFLGDIIGDIGVTFGGIYYDIRLFIYDIGATLYDIGILNYYLERCVVAKQEFSGIAFVFFEKCRDGIHAAAETVDITKIKHYLGYVGIAVVGFIGEVLQVDFAI